jgi:PAS domain S-box-containing protein
MRRRARAGIVATMSTPLSSAQAIPGSPRLFPTDTPLPLRATDFDAIVAPLLHRAIHGEPARDILTLFCGQLARLMNLRLAVLTRRLEGGALAVEAASAENGLWLELQRIPERWDSGVTSRGPAGAALNAGAPVHMRGTDDGFALWRAAAEAEHVREMLAIPIATAHGQWTLELFFDGEIARGASVGTLTVSRLAYGMEKLLDDLAILEERQLVAQALASAGNAAFVTDLEGTIVWSNAAFSALSGYAPDEVRGRNPNFLRSGQQGVRYYRDLWGTIRAGKVWSGETVDRARDGSTYTIQQTVSPVARDGRITHYVSIHQDIGRQKQARVELEIASRVSPRSGLLTAAAFELEVGRILSENRDREMAFVAVSLRGLQRATGALGDDAERLLLAALGQRLRENVPAGDLVADLGAFEHALLLRADVSEAGLRSRLVDLCEKLAEPLPFFGALPDLDIHFGMALSARDGATFHELRLKADRQLANEPYRRARRNAPN